MVKRITACICIAVLIIGQMCFIMPKKAYAATPKAGETLVVRVGYFGDNTDYRVKAKLSRSKMESLPQQLNYYTNLTRVGTVMTIIAEGPTLKKVLQSANIDIGSVRLIHLRTEDAKGKENNWFMEFSADKYLSNNLYYYPNLIENWERIEDGRGKPLKGALEGKKKIDSIIAVKSHSVKTLSGAQNLTPSKMTTEDSYRLCAGEVLLQELVETTAVSSSDAAKKIFGIDITLWGSPKEAIGLSLNLKDKNIKVGSAKRVSAKVKGQELFEDKVDKNLKWRSSDNDIATVDKNGNVTVKKKGKVTITAETSNGIEKSIIINGTDENDPQENDIQGGGGGIGDSATGGGKGKTIKGKDGVRAKEVLLGDRIMEDVTDKRPTMADDAVELTEEKVDPVIMYTAGSVALALFLIGIIISNRSYRREV